MHSGFSLTLYGTKACKVKPELRVTGVSLLPFFSNGLFFSILLELIALTDKITGSIALGPFRRMSPIRTARPLLAQGNT